VVLQLPFPGPPGRRSSGRQVSSTPKPTHLLCKHPSLENRSPRMNDPCGSGHPLDLGLAGPRTPHAGACHRLSIATTAHLQPRPGALPPIWPSVLKPCSLPTRDEHHPHLRSIRADGGAQSCPMHRGPTECQPSGCFPPFHTVNLRALRGCQDAAKTRLKQDSWLKPKGNPPQPDSSQTSFLMMPARFSRPRSAKAGCVAAVSSRSSPLPCWLNDRTLCRLKQSSRCSRLRIAALISPRKTSIAIASRGSTRCSRVLG